ncbi:MAG: helix-turn-helix transcriptional regulator [Verrucomicrobiales bacterium]|nr:helix-turn-helix transcriptional regulator [Verrucomicrobiales bacterium]
MGSCRFSTELVRSSTDLVILTLLLARPMYGYEILVTLADRGNGEFRFKQGTLYPLLYRLEREGWIRAKWETPPTGKKRKVYTLTADGKKAQRSRSAEWQRFTAAVDSILNEKDHE